MPLPGRLNPERARQPVQQGLLLAVSASYGSIVPAAHNSAIHDRSATQLSPAANGESRLIPSAKMRADLERMRRELEQRLARQIAHGVVAVDLGREGLVISLREAVFQFRKCDAKSRLNPNPPRNR